MTIRRLSAKAAFCVLAACATPEPEGLLPTPPDRGPRVLFDLTARPLPEIPFPNDMATRLDPSSPTGRRVNASVAAPTLLESDVRDEFDRLDGWGTFAAMTVSFDAPIDPLDVRRRHFDDDYSNDAVYLVNLGTGEPAALDLGRGNYPVTLDRTERYFGNDPDPLASNVLFDVQSGTDAQGVVHVPNTAHPERPPVGRERPEDPPNGNHVYRDLLEFYERASNTLILRPVVPLEQRTLYAVVVTRDLHGADGHPVRSPFPYVNHAAQTEQLRPLLPILDAKKIPGLVRERVAFAWAFTTESITSDLEQIREGLHGRGPLASLSEKFPAVLEPVQTLDKGEDETTWHPIRPLMDKATAAALGTSVYTLPGTKLRDVMAQLGRDLDMGAGPQFDAILDSFKAIDYMVYGSFKSPDFLDDPAVNTAEATWRVAPEIGLARVWQRPSDWVSIEADGLAAALQLSEDAADRHRAAKQALRDRVTFFLTIPKATDRAKPPFPVFIWGHGAGSTREEGLPYAGFLARHGIATAAINSYAHGLAQGPLMTSIIEAAGQQHGVTPLVRSIMDGRARDHDNDGTEDSGGDFWVGDTFHVRDVVRQSIVDWVQLARVLKAFGTWRIQSPGSALDGKLAGDFNGDGTLDAGGPETLDGKPNPGSRIFLAGGSLGGILTGVGLAVEPSFTLGVPISGGGGLGDIGIRTDLGGVIENVFLEIMGPLVVGYPAASGMNLQFEVNVVGDSKDLPISDPAAPLDIRPGDRVVLENLNSRNGPPQKDSVVVGADRRIRLAVGADGPGFHDESPTNPGEVRVGACESADTRAVEKDRLKLYRFADCLVVHVLRKDASGVEKEVLTIDRFGADAKIRNRTLPKGSPLVAPERGLGFKKGTRDLRRFMMLAQGIMDPADPVNFAPHYFKDPLPARAGKPAGVMFMPTQGDMSVPCNTGYATARAAGALPYTFDPVRDAAWGMSPNDVVIRSFAMQANEKLQYYRPVAAHMRNPEAPVAEEDRALVSLVECEQPEHCEQPSLVDITGYAKDSATGAWLDDTNDYMRGYGGAPRLKVPLRDAVTVDYPGTDWQGRSVRMKSSFVPVYADAHGRHGLEPPDPTFAFDLGSFVVNMMARYFTTDGTVVSTDVCMHRDGWDRRPTEPDAQRVPACGWIPPPPQ